MKSKIEHTIGTLQEQGAVWLYLVPIVLASFVEQQSTDTRSWVTFGYVLLVGAICFAPTVIFKHFQSCLRQGWPKFVYRFSYGFLFLIYPMALLWIVVSWLDNSGISSGFFALAGAGLLAIEGLQKTSQFFQSKIKKELFSFSPKVGFETSILLVLVILSCIVAFTAVSSLPTISAGSELVIQLTFSPKIVFDNFLLFLGYSFQFFIYFLCWYLFYYVNHYWLYRIILVEKGVFFYLLSLPAVIVLIYPLVGQLILWLPLTERIPDLLPSGNSNPFDLLNGIIGTLVVLSTFPLILIRQWYRKNERITDLERQRAEAELAMLKQQINPHFFLNTLNNLYALSLSESDQTPEMIMRLSELMRYVLYQGSRDSVKLEEEIGYIEDYLKLQQIRLPYELDLTFEKNVSNPQLKVPPLLLIVFVENAFKHGIEPDDEAAYMRLNLKAGGNQLQFVCENSVPETVEDKAGGIGLENLRRRLELQFPDSNDLQIMQNPGSFKAELVIQFDNNES